MWVVAALAGLATLAPELDEALAPEAAPGGYAILRAADGHFYAELLADGEPIRVMVDAGSDRLLLAGEDARRLGIAAGLSSTSVEVARLSIGPHKLERVQAVIAPNLPVSLIGGDLLRQAAGGADVLR